MASGPVVRAVVTISVLGRAHPAFVVKGGSAPAGDHFPRLRGSLKRCGVGATSASLEVPTPQHGSRPLLHVRGHRRGDQGPRLSTAHLFLAAWRDAGGTQPAFPCSGAGNPALPVPQVQRTGGPKAEWQAEKGLGAPHIPGGSGPRSTPTTTLMKLGRYATPTGRTLEKCKRHRQIPGKLE